MNQPYRPKKLNDEQKAQAILLYKEGFSLRKIAKIMSVSHEWIRLIVREDSDIALKLAKD